MKELQSLLSEANLMTQHIDTELSMPILPVWVMYEVSNTTVDLPIGIGRIQDIKKDYQQANGIGTVIPSIAGFADVLASIESVAWSIVDIAEKHAHTIQDIATLTQEHIIHTFPHAKNPSRWGFFRIQITAKSAVFQILFLSQHGVFIPAYEWDIKKIADGSAFEAPPFTRLPPLLEIPKHYKSTEYVPATHENISHLLASTPNNAPQKQLYRSHTQHVLKKTAKLAEDLLAA